MKHLSLTARMSLMFMSAVIAVLTVAGLSFNMLSQHPVSYTHLDVYKRQALGLRLNVCVHQLCTHYCFGFRQKCIECLLTEMAEDLVLQREAWSPCKNLPAGGQECFSEPRGRRLVGIYKNHHAVTQVQKCCSPDKTVIGASPAGVHIRAAMGQE